jgi:predicted  nucleic acid-binding Zn-ribbon protein
LPEEIEAWKVTVAQAQQGVDEKERETQPIRDKIAALTAQIDAESRTLKQITEERRNRRLEMQDGVKRVAGSGLQGRVGATTF